MKRTIRKQVKKQILKQILTNKTEPSVSNKNKKFQKRIINYDFSIISAKVLSYRFALDIVGSADTIDYALRITHYALIYCALRIIQRCIINYKLKIIN